MGNGYKGNITGAVEDSEDGTKGFGLALAESIPFDADI